MLLDHTYFVRELALAQLSQPSVLENFNFFNKKYQKKFLREILGIDLAKLLEEDLEKIEAEKDPRFSPILNGIVFSDANNIVREWIGLQNEDKESPLANYVFYWIATDGISYQTGVGESSGISENSNRANVDDRLVFVWNEMTQWLLDLQMYIEQSSDYPEYSPLIKFEIKNTFNL